jgi:hypothetical protein
MMVDYYVRLRRQQLQTDNDIDVNAAEFSPFCLSFFCVSFPQVKQSTRRATLLIVAALTRPNKHFRFIP